MIDNKFHYEGDIYTDKGVRIPNAIIDTAIICGHYETMALKHGKEYACVTVDSLEEAEKVFEDMIERFTVRNKPTKPIEKPLTGKYAKLRDDLIKAVEAGKKADYGEDGGTCNFDAPALILPKWVESKVKQAAKEAGISAFKWDSFGQTKFVFGTPTSAQGNRNTRVAEAMEAVLRSLQYETILYQAMD